MPHVVTDTDQLVADGLVTPDVAREIEARGRQTMVRLAINAVLCFGILSATTGLIFWLANAVSVAVVGALFLGGGLALLSRRTETYAMFGNAAALIGAGMLIGGAAIELLDKYEDIAGWAMLAGGTLVMAIAGRALLRGGLTARFVAGAILLMGIALHLGGLGLVLFQNEVAGIGRAAYHLYAAAIIAGTGWVTDVRLVTAIAIVPFAQALETGSTYFHAAYVFYSPEPTLSILQMAALIAVGLWWVRGREERDARHVRIIVIMAFIVANLCALVGSLWGDVVGETIWGPGVSFTASEIDDFDAYNDAVDAFRANAVVISENVYSVVWAVALAAVIFWAAHASHRGLFNAALTFAAIHAYTQLFESFGDEPLAYVIGGLAAIPLAWGMWRVNQIWLNKENDGSEEQ